MSAVQAAEAAKIALVIVTFKSSPRRGRMRCIISMPAKRTIRAILSLPLQQRLPCE